ncbi:hypothetical protein [Rhodococcus sp. IEGM 1330]|uniref:hypothetical protein n=1 Tax=Rhodococcus sp. IEGM 1330 TaxID=3082225 RepID=UPI002952DC0A|nr:hypothetical protein [Rhodococcus sp. IEGM 1330]MDV8024967.1 hypothetical protein [Rhodococcus sp. IEGM 1330]
MIDPAIISSLKSTETDVHITTVDGGDYYGTIADFSSLDVTLTYPPDHSGRFPGAVLALDKITAIES